MPALAVGRRADGRLHEEGQLLLREIAQNGRIQGRSQIVRVADEGIFIPGSQ